MNESQKICQACLSNKTLLSPLWKLEPILCDIGAWGLTRVSGGGVCWECKNRILKFYNFKIRVCKAQHILANAEMVMNLDCLSTMAASTQSLFDHNYCYCETSESHSDEGVPITVKQEMIDQYTHDNPGLNIEVGSPRTERGSEAERTIYQNVEASCSMQVAPLAVQTSEKESQYQNGECTRSELWSLPEPNGIDTEILNNIKTEHEEINTNTSLELVSEEVQVKEEPLSEGDFLHSDIDMDNAGKSHAEEEVSGNLEEHSNFNDSGNPQNELRKQQKQWENAVTLVYKSEFLPVEEYSLLPPKSQNLTSLLADTVKFKQENNVKRYRKCRK